MSDEREFCSTTGKLIHETPQIAARVAKNRDRFGKAAQPYRCEHCNLWHTGRPNGRSSSLRHAPKRRRNF